MNDEILIKNLVKLVTDSVNSGMVQPEYEGEIPNLERIDASLKPLFGHRANDWDHTIKEVYQKLRKRGVLAKIRPSKK